MSLTDPADRITHDGSVTMTVLVLLESVTPAERATFARVARYLAGIRRCRPELRVAHAGVNRGEGLVLDHGGLTVAVMAFDVRDHLISRVWMVSNPDKLKSWQPKSAAARSRE